MTGRPAATLKSSSTKMTDTTETVEQIAVRTCRCKRIFKTVRGLNIHISNGSCAAVPRPAKTALPPCFDAGQPTGRWKGIEPPAPPSDFAKALADLAEQSEKRFLQFKEESDRTLANLTAVMSNISERKKTFATVAAAPAPAPAPATPSPLPSLPASPPESVKSHNPNPTLEFIFKKIKCDQTSDYWWVLKEAYNINPERFEIVGLSHYSNEEEMAHITISYRIPTYKGSWVKNYFHIYHDGDPTRPCYRTITGAGLNRTTIILAVFHSKK